MSSFCFLNERLHDCHFESAGPSSFTHSYKSNKKILDIDKTVPIKVTDCRQSVFS